MVFNSLTFAVFFAAVIGLHALSLPWRVRKFNLLLGSYLFYAAWNPPFVVLLWMSTLVDWFVARAMGSAEGKHRRRALLLVSLCTNLGILGFFKYGDFVLENFTALMAVLGVVYQPLELDVVLPVGISFYTFQTLSYTIDVYRGKMRPWGSFLDFALFVTFFPQLVAGPIVRAADFLPQCTEPRRSTRERLGWGLSLLTLGLFEKVSLADGLIAPIVDKVFEKPENLTAIEAWTGALGFSLQIFFDFAGYSTCAIGAAMCLGFDIPRNFRFPYAAIGFRDFWRRWHVSLSTWLRDYLYVSLGGNRKGNERTYVNVMMTMLIGGLWHGASWNFVYWGGLHGLYLCIERFVINRIEPGPYWGRWPVRMMAALATFLAVTVTWVFFRSTEWTQSVAYLTSMIGSSGWGMGDVVKSNEAAMIGILTVLTLCIHGVMRERTLEDMAAVTPWWLKSMTLAGMLVAIATMGGEGRAFIYFQF